VVEPGLAVLGFRERETSADRGPPVPVLARTPSGDQRRSAAPLRVLSLHDQHVAVAVDQAFGWYSTAAMRSGFSS
jgi:hypothetical protein